MKFFLLLVAVVGLTMASCRKIRTCECVTTNKATNMTSEDSYRLRTTKKQMEVLCADDNYEDAYEKTVCTVK